MDTSKYIYTVRTRGKAIIGITGHKNEIIGTGLQYTHVYISFPGPFIKSATFSFHLQYRLIVFIVHKPHVVSMVMVLYSMRMGTVRQIEQTLNSVNVVDINTTGMVKNMIIYLKCKWNGCTCTCTYKSTLFVQYIHVHVLVLFLLTITKTKIILVSDSRH